MNVARDHFRKGISIIDRFSSKEKKEARHFLNDSLTERQREVLREFVLERKLSDEQVDDSKLRSLRSMYHTVQTKIDVAQPSADQVIAGENNRIVIGRPTVFLSHSHVDKPFVRKLAQMLLKEGIDCWLDEAELHLGESLIERISDAVASVDFVLAVLSPDSVGSKWVKEELQMAMNRQVQLGDVIILPVVRKSCEIPKFLEARLRLDLSSSRKLKGNFPSLIRDIRFHHGKRRPV